MKQQSRNARMRIKRKNQNSRKRAKKAVKKPPMNVLKAKALGQTDIKDTIQPYSKSLHANQAIV